MSGFKRFINLIEVDHPDGLSQSGLFLSVRPMSGFANSWIHQRPPEHRPPTSTSQEPDMAGLELRCLVRFRILNDKAGC